MRLLVHGLAGYTKGGIETFVINMAAYMSDNILFDYVIERDGEHDNVRMPGKGDTLFISPKKSMFANLKDWSRLLKERRGIDSAVYFNWYSLAWLFPAMIARAKGYKVIIHAHNNKLHDCGFLQKALHSVNRQVQKCMKITRLTNSELSAKFFFGNKPAEVIYNAIEPEKFRFDEDIRNKFRSELCFENKHVYGFSGRIAYQKNPLFLMEVFSEIKKKDPDAGFLVCGDGDLMKKAKETAQALGIKVAFVGIVPNIQDYYNAMDVFVLPSRFEGLGIVLIEAQCSGLPCVASANVIPNQAKATELITFVSLKKGADVWATECINSQNNSINRHKFSELIYKSRYNIAVEAEKLEMKLSSSL